MRFENDQGWVEIEFKNYANETCSWRSGLTDERNCVELGFNFSVKGIGWGCVGDEYFLTTDIKALAEGAADIRASVTDSFSHSVEFPYEVICEEKEFCRISFSRNREKIRGDLRIWDGLCEYIELGQDFGEEAFGAIADELAAAAKKFPEK